MQRWKKRKHTFVETFGFETETETEALRNRVFHRFLQLDVFDTDRKREREIERKRAKPRNLTSNARILPFREKTNDFTRQLTAGAITSAVFRRTEEEEEEGKKKQKKSRLAN